MFQYDWLENLCNKVWLLFINFFKTPSTLSSPDVVKCLSNCSKSISV